MCESLMGLLETGLKGFGPGVCYGFDIAHPGCASSVQRAALTWTSLGVPPGTHGGPTPTVTSSCLPGRGWGGESEACGCMASCGLYTWALGSARSLGRWMHSILPGMEFIYPHPRSESSLRNKTCFCK